MTAQTFIPDPAKITASQVYEASQRNSQSIQSLSERLHVIEEAHISERLARIEEGFSSVKYMLSGITLGVACVLIERALGIAGRKKMRAEHEVDTRS